MSKDALFDYVTEILPVLFDGAETFSDFFTRHPICDLVFKLTLAILQVGLSGYGIATGYIGLEEYKQNKSAIALNKANTTTDHLVQVWEWGMGLSILAECSGFALIVFSVILLLVSKILNNKVHPFGKNQSQSIQFAHKLMFFWQKATFLMQFCCEDCMVSMSKIFIAFTSVEDEALLKTSAERQASIVAAAVALFELVLVIIPVMHKFWHFRLTSGLIWALVFLLFGCIAASPAVLTMLISTEMFEVHHDDPKDLYLNLWTLYGFSTGSFLIICMICALIGCVRSNKKSA